MALGRMICGCFLVPDIHVPSVQLDGANNFFGVGGRGMVGVPNRSGGHNRSVSGSSLGDGRPESPRQLSPRAGEIDERLAAMLRADPENLSLMRLKGQYTDRLSRLSALVPLSPRDRERLPTAEPAMVADDPFTSIMERMARG
jgi:hypothetical protein